ncbi:hypothetical protein, partial [Selenomonas sp. WCT3]|uniref:hypothetical protein n=1 Tax=Selenomonas sp. WCT3 TaxID=3158785 RepID=UPI001C593D1D
DETAFPTRTQAKISCFTRNVKATLMVLGPPPPRLESVRIATPSEGGAPRNLPQTQPPLGAVP